MFFRKRREACRLLHQEMNALAWANDYRQSHGMQPLDALPRGLRGVSGECPMARAIAKEGFKSGFGVQTWWVIDENNARHASFDLLPLEISRFVIDFDMRGYEHLIDKDHLARSA